jgi:hypothetical protein
MPLKKGTKAPKTFYRSVAGQSIFFRLVLEGRKGHHHLSFLLSFFFFFFFLVLLATCPLGITGLKKPTGKL